MPLDNLIATSYGSQDGIFAGHPADRERARESIIVAEEENVGFNEFLELHRQYLEGKGFSEIHIQEQLERVRNLSNYFE